MGLPQKRNILQQRRTLLLQQHYQDLQQVPNIDQQLHDIEDRIEAEMKVEAERLIKRSHVKWTEHGESNTKYFFRVLKERNRRMTINGIRDPIHDTYSSTPTGMLKQARQFYQHLYTADPCHQPAIETLLTTIPSAIVTDQEQQTLMAPM
ncbi:hypothetical protein, partial, partial [Absidia glauca]